MIYTLGILTGIILTGISILVTILLRPKIERSFSQLESKLKEKGKIIEPENHELAVFLDEISDEDTE